MRKTGQVHKNILRRFAVCAVCAVLFGSLAGCGASSGKTDAQGGVRTARAETYDLGFAEEESSYSATLGVSGTSEEDLITEADLSAEEYGTKLIKTVNMDVETTEFDAFRELVQNRAEEMGGYVERADVSSPGENENRWAYLAIRIPADCLDDFLALVGENGNVTYTSESVEDVTLRYVDLETHVSELETEQETLEAMLADAESVEDLIAIQAQLTEIRYEIESYASQLKVLENQVSYSTVYLNLSEVDRETSAAADSFGQSVRTRFGDSLYRLGQGLRNFAVGFLGLLPIILLWVVIAAAALAVVLGCVHHRRKKTGKAKKKNEEESE